MSSGSSQTDANTMLTSLTGIDRHIEKKIQDLSSKRTQTKPKKGRDEKVFNATLKTRLFKLNSFTTNRKRKQIMEDSNEASEDEYEFLYSSEEEEDDEEGETHQDIKSTSTDGIGLGLLKNDNNTKLNSEITSTGIQMIKAQNLFPIMQQKIQDVSEVLGLNISIVYPLLHKYKWNKELLLEAFMEDPEAVTKKVGVYSRYQDTGKRKALKISEGSLTCPICFDIFKSEEMIAMPCSHSFCKDCWRGYLTSKIGDGPSCTGSFCPAVGCHELVTEVEVQSAVPDLLEIYRSYQLRNFVDMDRSSRWCMGTDCEHIAVVQNHADIDEKLVAICKPCDISFCMKCGEEPHAPINCCALKDWNALCKSESANVQWIISKTKPCPKCGSRIEKNQGCNHMRCLKCQHGFCWVCKYFPELS